MCAVLLSCNPLSYVFEAMNIRLLTLRSWKSRESCYCRISRVDENQGHVFSRAWGSRALLTDEILLRLISFAQCIQEMIHGGCRSAGVF